MDDKSLHDLLNGALAGEPPLGPVAQNALAAGIRLRRSRRIRAAAATAAAAVIAVTIPVGLGVRGHLAGPEQPPGTPILYVGTYTSKLHTRHTYGGTVVPINTATNTPGTPIQLVGGPNSPTIADNVGKIAITPNGKTAYVTTDSSVTPVSTATNTPGRPIHIAPSANGFDYPDFIAITPDGKTAYVANVSGTVVPISTATNTPGKPIRVHKGGQIWWAAITPDGKTLYVLTWGGAGPNQFVVTPISTATNTPGKPIPVGTTSFIGTDIGVGQIAITPDGKTVYAANNVGTITPINTATGTPGKPIHISGNSTQAIAITP